MLRLLRRTLHAFFRARQEGSIIVLFAAMLPLGAVALGYGVDYVRASSMSASLQRIADAAAIGSAREMRVTYAPSNRAASAAGRGPNNRTLSAVAQNIVDAYADDRSFPVSARARVVAKDTVQVEVSAAYTPILRQILGDETVTMSASATAEVWGGEDICVIALESSYGAPGVILHEHAKVTGPTCGVYSNSPAKDSILAQDSSRLNSRMICARGGYYGSSSNFSQTPLTDCPTLPDPLANRPYPIVERVCEANNAVIRSGEVATLSPGVYCGGLVIEGDADVWLAPGEYIFQNGPLIVRDNARMRGERVGLFFDDAQSHFEFLDDAEIALSAPETGRMAGLLIFSRRVGGGNNDWSPREFVITSANVHTLIGTVYIAEDDLTIETTVEVAQESAFTIILADSLTLRGAPNLVLNTNYAATTVPVPDGLTGLQRSTRLIR